MRPGRVIESLLQVYRIVEWRDGCVYRTQYVEDRWIPLDEKPPEGYQYVSMPTSYTDPTIRSRKL